MDGVKGGDRAAEELPRLAYRHRLGPKTPLAQVRLVPRVAVDGQAASGKKLAPHAVQVVTVSATAVSHESGGHTLEQFLCICREAGCRVAPQSMADHRERWRGGAFGAEHRVDEDSLAGGVKHKRRVAKVVNPNLPTIPPSR
jgi:hypothetical protein